MKRVIDGADPGGITEAVGWKAVLAKCEWGHDDYSLQVENLPKAPPKPGQQNLF